MTDLERFETVLREVGLLWLRLRGGRPSHRRAGTQEGDGRLIRNYIPDYLKFDLSYLGYIIKDFDEAGQDHRRSRARILAGTTSARRPSRALPRPPRATPRPFRSATTPRQASLEMHEVCSRD